MKRKYWWVSSIIVLGIIGFLIFVGDRGLLAPSAKEINQKQKLHILYRRFVEYSQLNNEIQPARLGLLIESGGRDQNDAGWITGYSGDKKLYEPSGLFYFQYPKFSPNVKLPLLASYKVLRVKTQEVILLWSNGEITFEPIRRFDLLVIEYNLHGESGNFTNPKSWPLITSDGRLVR